MNFRIYTLENIDQISQNKNSTEQFTYLIRKECVSCSHMIIITFGIIKFPKAKMQLMKGLFILFRLLEIKRSIKYFEIFKKSL